MAIGALVGIAVSPILLQTHFEPLNMALSAPHVTLIKEGLIVATSVIGSSIPDLDEQHAIASRKIEHGARLIVILLVIAAMVMLHLAANPVMWILMLLIFATFSIQANFARRVALLMFAVGMLYMSASKAMPIFAGILFALWCIGAMFAKHRTFTHSIAGFAIFSIAAFLGMSQYHFGLLGYALAIGYMFHILADMIAGGTKLLWPFPFVSKNRNYALLERLPDRVGIRLVQTAGVVDHMIGTVSIMLFLLAAVF